MLCVMGDEKANEEIVQWQQEIKFLTEYRDYYFSRGIFKKEWESKAVMTRNVWICRRSISGHQQMARC